MGFAGMGAEQALVRRRALILGGVCVVGMAVVYVLAVRTAAGQRFEDAVLRSADLSAGSLVHVRALDVLAAMTLPAVGVAVVLVALIGLLRNRPVLGLLSAGTVIASVATTEVCRRLLDRPVLLPHGDRREDQSFPSGHVTVAMSLMCAVVLVVPYRCRGVVLGLASLLATGVGIATVTTGWHRPGDSVGAGFVVVGHVCAAVAVLARSGRVHKTPLWTRAVSTLLADAYVTVAVAGVVICVALTASGGSGAGAAPLLAGCSLVLSATAAVAAAVLTLVRQVDLGTPPAGRADEGSPDVAPGHTGFHRPSGP